MTALHKSEPRERKRTQQPSPRSPRSPSSDENTPVRRAPRRKGQRKDAPHRER